MSMFTVLLPFSAELQWKSTCCGDDVQLFLRSGSRLLRARAEPARSVRCSARPVGNRAISAV